MTADTSSNSSVLSISVAISNAQQACTVNFCPSPLLTDSTGSFPYGEFDVEVIGKNTNTTTLTVSTGSGSLTLKITSSTESAENVTGDFNAILF